MSSVTNIISIMRSIPRNVDFSSRLRCLERLESQCNDEVGQHSKRVSDVASRFASSYGFDRDFVKELEEALRWHDIGKLATPPSVLQKPEKLNVEELVVIKMHPIDGILLLGDEAPQMWKDVVQYHHERYDGCGYYGLKGEEIPVAARLASIADVFDALTSARAYKDAMTVEEALLLMTSDVESPGFGRRSFDPLFLRAFVADQTNKIGDEFSADGLNALEVFAVSDPMDDFKKDKHNNDGWLLRADGYRFKFTRDKDGVNTLIKIVDPMGDPLPDLTSSNFSENAPEATQLKL